MGGQTVSKIFPLLIFYLLIARLAVLHYNQFFFFFSMNIIYLSFIYIIYLFFTTNRYKYPGNFAAPLKIEIEASNGASDYGNKFGEPVIQVRSISFFLSISLFYYLLLF